MEREIGVANRVIHEALRKVFASTLSEELLNQLADTVRVKEYPAGTLLCKERAIEDTFYILLDGRVDIMKHLEGGLHFIDTLQSTCFGELALILDEPRTADVITAEATRVIEINRSDLDAFAKQSPEIVIAICKIVIKRTLAQLDRSVEELAKHRRKIQTPPKFFVSYARKDQPFVEQLAIDLKRRSIDVWLDIHNIDPGLSWSRQVGRALDMCSAMILVLSPDGLESENVDDEWNYYLDNKKMIVPLLYRECRIPFRLHKLQFINFTQQPYDTALSHLVSALHVIQQN
jgi:CRP-like cAMP-binding protein